MKAGRELDALVAERFMGWVRHRIKSDDPYNIWTGDGRIRGSVESWRPSTDIAAAWEVVEKLGEKYFVDVYNCMESADPKVMKWCCEIGSDKHPPSIEQTADTAALAICLAALELAERK